MGFFDFITKKFISQPTQDEPTRSEPKPIHPQPKPVQSEPKQSMPKQTEPDNISVNMHIQYNNSTKPTIKVQTPDETYQYDLNTEYVCLSTSGDENVCPMCAQFEGKFFPIQDAPKLPLCPSCACAYKHYLKKDLPLNTEICSKDDFALPAKCTSIFYKHQQNLYNETDIDKQIRLCERDIKKLPEFMAPYISAGFPAPPELICRDLLPELYMQLGEWKKAEKAIKKCIDSQAYSPDDGTEELANLASYQKIATQALLFIKEHPGCLQRNIYKAVPCEGEEREQFKDFLKNSKQIKKIKHGNTNELYLNEVQKTISQKP